MNAIRQTDELILKHAFRKHLPGPARFIESEQLVSFGDIIRFCGVLKRNHETESVLRGLREELGSVKNKKIAVCPAGGLTKDVISIARETGHTVTGVLDSFKAESQDSYLGEPLYPLSCLDSLEADLIILTSSAYGDELFERIAGSFPSYADRIVHPFIDEAFLKKDDELTVKTFNDIIRSSEGKPVVLFAVNHFPVNFVKRVRALKNCGCVTLLMSLDRNCTGVTGDHRISDCFDHIYNSGGDILSFLTVFMNLEKNAVLHLMPIVMDTLLSILLMAMKKFRTVCEFHDVLCTMHTESSLSEALGNEDAHRLLAQESFLYRNADVISYKDSPAVLDILEREYQVKKNAIQFQAYCGDVVKPYDKRQKLVRIVYSGGVLSQKSAGGGATTSLYEIADLITSQNICFDIYNAYDRQDGTYKAYDEKAEKNPLFSYHPPVANERVIETLAGYDFGWNVVDLRTCPIQTAHRETTMSTKLFDYLSAGLPVFVSKELRYMASFVEENGLGIALSYDDIFDLSAIIRQCDYNGLLNNVRRFQENHSLDTEILRYRQVYSDLMV